MMVVIDKFEKIYERVKSDISKKVRNRQNSNEAIIKILADTVKKYPDLRFGQILYILDIIRQDKSGNIIDIFSEEPDDTLRRIKRKL